MTEHSAEQDAVERVAQTLYEQGWRLTNPYAIFSATWWDSLSDDNKNYWLTSARGAIAAYVTSPVEKDI